MVNLDRDYYESEIVPLIESTGVSIQEFIKTAVAEYVRRSKQ